MLSIEVFDEGIENLKNNFPDAIFTEFKYDVWLDKLSDELSDEEFKTAIREAIFSFGKCPTGKELVSLVKESERELVSKCWSRCLEALAKRLSLDDLDDASLYAIVQLGGMSYLGSLENTQLHYLNTDFKTHWFAYRKSPKEFNRPTQVTRPEQLEFKPTELEAQISPEQLKKNQEFRDSLIATHIKKSLNGAVNNDN